MEAKILTLNKKFLLIMSFMIFLILTGCSSKPGKDEVIHQVEQKLSLPDLKQMKCDISSYIKIDKVEILKSYKEGKYYIIDAKVHFKILKNLDKQTIYSLYKQCPIRGRGILNNLIVTLEYLKGYNTGQITDTQLAMLTAFSLFGAKPMGILKKGDDISTMKKEYKFIKTDDGWKSVDD
jgi:hypothetical protein